jgi:transcriptional regulator with XRE-family HTH domain
VPPLPPADENGNYPAVETTEALIARGIVRDREAMGMTQKELAAAAGIQAAMLNRIERGVNLPSMRTAKKIETALARAGLRRRPSSSHRKN